LQIAVFLFVVAVAAGYLDTLAGGGGLITVPALLMCGIPIHAALGTNKLQGSCGTGMATYVLLRRKNLSLKEIKQPALMACAGAAAGTFLVQYIDTDTLQIFVPI